MSSKMSLVLPEKLLQYRLLSPQSHSSCPDPSLVQVLHEITSSFRAHPLALAWGPSQTAESVSICSTVNLRGLQRDLHSGA